MNRRNFLRKTGIVALTISAGGKAAFASKTTAIDANTSKKPNIVFLLIDDMGWKDVGFMGSKYYETPNIDKLAKSGMVFSNAYSNAPNCAPTRACLMSGQYSPRHGIYTVGSSERGQSHQRKLIPTPNKTELDSKFITIAEALKKSDYTSASMGKWHLGTDPKLGPIGQGFDLNIAGDHRGNPGRGGYFSPYKNPNLSDGPDGEYLTDRLTDEAIKFIEKNKEKPFFLYLPHYAVHTPIQAKKDLIEKYENKTPHNGQGNPKYAAMIDSTDQGIGRILDTLEKLKIKDNTIVVFFSDNGGYGPATSMAPLRGAKGMLYEGGIRVPMVVSWPGKIKTNTTCETPVIGIDFYPTLLEMTSTEKPANYILDGKSIVPLLNQSKDFERKSIYFHFPAYLQKYSNGKTPWRATPAGAIRKGDYKLIEFFEDSTLELYNLNDDIGETNNLAKIMPDKTKELHRDMTEWRKSVNAHVPTELNPNYNPNKEVKKKGNK